MVQILSPHLLPEQTQKRKQQKREESQNYQSKHKRGSNRKGKNHKITRANTKEEATEKGRIIKLPEQTQKRKQQKREESNGLDALSCSDSGCANNGGSCVEGKCRCNRRGKKKSARNARMQNVFY